jgi:hypothetical protein
MSGELGPSHIDVVTNAEFVGVDPAVAAGVTLLEADYLRIVASISLARSEAPATARDLSPLGR